MDTFIESAKAERERVRAELRAFGRQRWHEVSSTSGVPFSTLKKFGYGQVEDPGFTVVRAADLAMADMEATA